MYNMMTATAGLLCVLGLTHSGAGLVPNIGKCRGITFNAPANFVLQEFCSEKQGKYEIKMVSGKVENVKNIYKNFHADGEGCSLEEYTTLCNDSTILTSKENLVGFNQVGSGQALKTYPSQVTLKVQILRWEKGRWALVYLCANDGADTDVDYRIVLAHESLTNEDKYEISSFDTAYKFNGQINDVDGKDCEN